TAHELPAIAEHVKLFGQEPLKVSFDPVFDQAGVDTELVGGVVQNLVDRDHEQVGRLRVGDSPHGGDTGRGLLHVDLFVGEHAGRTHPVQRLVAEGIRVDEYTSIALEQQQPGGNGQVGAEPPCVIH